MSKSAVFAIAESEPQARQAVSNLEAAGFSMSDISVLSRNSQSHQVEEGTVGAAKDPSAPGGTGTSEVGHRNSTKAPEGTTWGVTTGGGVGGIAGWLVGIGALAIPGVGPFIAAGPILAALSGAAIVATVGGVAGALIGFGIPEHEAKLYAGRLNAGHILIGVHAENSEAVSRAKKALEDARATAIKTTSEAVAH